jgi:hypothetical protein
MVTNIDPTTTNLNVAIKNNLNTPLRTVPYEIAGNSMRIFSVADIIPPTNSFESIGSLSLDWDIGRMNIWGVNLNYEKARGYPILYTKEMNTSPTYIPFWQVSKIINNDTFLMINNLGTDDISANIYIYDHNGTRIGAGAPNIASGRVGVVKISDFIGPNYTYGSAIVKWDSNTPVKMWSTIFDTVAGTGHVLQLNNSVTSVSPVHVPYFQRGESINTYILVSNMGNKATIVNYEFLSPSGETSGRKMLSIKPHVTEVITASSSTMFSEGRAIVSWDEGEISLWANITNPLTNSVTSLTFDKPKGSEER